MIIIQKIVIIYLEKRKSGDSMKTEINTLEIKEELNILNSLSKSYEETMISIFNILKDSSFFWNDKIAESFYQELEIEKINHEKEIIKINEKINLYEYIYLNYSKIGNKIKCNLESREYITNKLNEYLKKISKIINMYEFLDTSFCLEEQEKIIKELNQLKNLENKVDEIKKNIIKTFDVMMEIEKEIETKIIKLDTIKIKEFEMFRFIKE